MSKSVVRTKRRKSPKTITRDEAVRRLGAMLKAIRRDVEIVLSAEAAFKTANDIIVATPEIERPGPATYSVIAQSLTFNIAMSLARLFDEGATRFKPNQRDIASIPLIVRLLRQKRCQDALGRQAREWLPRMPWVADSQEAACRKAVADAIAAYVAARSNRDGRLGIKRLNDMRNKVMAHSYMEEVLIAMPTYNQILRLVDTARDVLTAANLAIGGQNVDYIEYESEFFNQSFRFWNHALRPLDEQG